MRQNGSLKITNKFTGEIIGDRIKYADNFLLRLKGLLCRKNLSPGEGLLLYPCSSVHSFGMKFSIDVVFLDQNLHVLKTVSDMSPGFTSQQKGARYVLEMAGGTIDGKKIEVGDTLLFLCHPERSEG